MVQSLQERLLRLVVAGLASLVCLAVAEVARGQSLRGPDLGVWFIAQRGADGHKAFVVDDLIADGAFARAGLRAGDRIVSVDDQPMNSETKFAESFLVPGNHSVKLIIAREGQQIALTLKAAEVIEGMVVPDPLYQVGLLMDERRAESNIVQRVFPCTAAFYAGLRQGDSITIVNGQPMTSLSKLTQALHSGDNVNLVVDRNGQMRRLTLIPALGQQVASRRMRAESTPSGSSRLAPPLLPLPVPGNPPPLLAPPTIPSVPPVLPSSPPPIPALPRPGAVPNVRGV